MLDPHFELVFDFPQTETDESFFPDEFGADHADVKSFLSAILLLCSALLFPSGGDDMDLFVATVDFPQLEWDEAVMVLLFHPRLADFPDSDGNEDEFFSET